MEIFALYFGLLLTMPFAGATTVCMLELATFVPWPSQIWPGCHLRALQWSPGCRDALDQHSSFLRPEAACIPVLVHSFFVIENLAANLKETSKRGKLCTQASTISLIALFEQSWLDIISWRAPSNLRDLRRLACQICTAQCNA